VGATCSGGGGGGGGGDRRKEGKYLETVEPGFGSFYPKKKTENEIDVNFKRCMISVMHPFGQLFVT
jgi:hypothetical protein